MNVYNNIMFMIKFFEYINEFIYILKIEYLFEKYFVILLGGEV